MKVCIGNEAYKLRIASGLSSFTHRMRRALRHGEGAGRNKSGINWREIKDEFSSCLTMTKFHLYLLLPYVACFFAVSLLFGMAAAYVLDLAEG